MKISLHIKNKNRGYCELEIWTPNFTSAYLENENFRHRLYYDSYSTGEAYNHCGNKRRALKIFPNLNG